MSSFLIEFQNSRTNWQWKEAPLLADEDSDGLEFNDPFIVPDITDDYNYFTWTNFRILCDSDSNKINIWASIHSKPNQLDTSKRLHQSGDGRSSYGDYETLSGIFKNSNRFYIWIKGTSKENDYFISQDIYDDAMNGYAVSLNPSISPTSDISDIPNWLGWDPVSSPNGVGQYAHSVGPTSSERDVESWIIGWDNSCCNILTNSINPSIGLQQQASILDTYSSIEGMSENGIYWLGCEQDKYIYGKILYSLHDHTSPGHIYAGNYSLYTMLYTVGFKSCQLNISALQY